jgi:hypothetical protein
MMRIEVDLVWFNEKSKRSLQTLTKSVFIRRRPMGQGFPTTPLLYIENAYYAFEEGYVHNTYDSTSVCKYFMFTDQPRGVTPDQWSNRINSPCIDLVVR